MLAPRSGVRVSHRKYEVKYKKYKEGKDKVKLKYMNLIQYGESLGRPPLPPSRFVFRVSNCDTFT